MTIDPTQPLNALRAAVAAAAVAETNAEDHLANQLTRALTAHNPDTTKATHNLTRARDARRNAVKALKEVEGER